MLVSDRNVVERLLSRWVAWVGEHARRIALLTFALTPLVGLVAALNLGFNTDPSALFSSELRFQRLSREFSRYFPILTDSLLIVIDAETPERVREAAAALQTQLEARPEIFGRVYVPAENEFFERSGLLYLELDELDEFAYQMARLQPVIGELSREASLPTLTKLIRTGLDEGDVGPDDDRWRSVLDHFREATLRVYQEDPVQVSWESVVLEGSSFEPTTRRIIVSEPPLAYDSALSASLAIDEIRRLADEVGTGDERAVRVRISGYPAINYEEMIALIWDVGIAGLGSLIGVVGVLMLAFRCGRLVAAAGVTLVVGLVWTAGLAALTVGEFNAVSVAFAVLFVGLGIDFLIHLGLHVREGLHDGLTLPDALQAGVRRTGTALVLCALTTAIGFLSFLPTHYRGLSDLGVISGGGMLMILIQTFTLFPALLRLWLRPQDLLQVRATRPWRVPMFPVSRHPWIVCGTAAMAAALALLVAPQVHLDMNVIRMRDPGTESVQTFNDLIDSEDATPWFIDVLAQSLEEADQLSDRFVELDEVERSLTLTSFVPKDQEEKREILFDVAMMLDTGPQKGSRNHRPSEAEQIATLRELVQLLDERANARSPSPLSHSLDLFRQELELFLGRVESDPDPAEHLDALEQSFFARFPEQLERLRTALEPDEIKLSSLPASLRKRMLSESGKARVQVFPSEDLRDREAMVRFVAATRGVFEEVSGLPVNLVDSAAATADSLLRAMVLALGAIGLVLLLAWRRILDTLLVLVPLLLAAGLAATATYVLGISFNFTNIVVLPLLLGVGVDSCVHLVQHFGETRSNPRELLGSTTAQAVFYSALTTVASFGSLALAGHRGLASLGMLLVVAMILALLCTLVVLPALIAVTHGEPAPADIRREAL